MLEHLPGLAAIFLTFFALKTYLTGKHFKASENVTAAVSTYSEKLPKSDYENVELLH